MGGSLSGLASMAIPIALAATGVGSPLALALVAGGLGAAKGLAGGQGPLQSLFQGAVQGGTQYGMGKLFGGGGGASRTDATTQGLIDKGFNIGNINARPMDMPTQLTNRGFSLMNPMQSNPMLFGSGRFF